MVKEQYVLAHHDHKIFYQANKDIFRTYVGTSRKEVTRRKQKDLIDYLYNYYKEREESSLTLLQVFERSEKYRLEAENKSQNTIERDKDTFYRFFEKSFYNRRIKDISEDDIARNFNMRSKELRMKERALKDTKQLLGRIFKYAIKQEKLLTENPVQLDLENYYQNCIPSEKTDDEKLFTREEISIIEDEIRRRLEKSGYDSILYAMLFSIRTGVRAGEIPTLRWADVDDESIHIHTQQKLVRRKGKPRLLEELPYTKNERRHPKNGRFFPVSDEIQALLDEIREKQAEMGIQSEFIFCNTDGSWVNKETYEQRLRRLCEKLGFVITNNHAFRKSLNSFVFIPLGIPVTQRAYLLGHTVEVNLRYYSFTRIECLKDVKNLLNEKSVPARSRKNVVDFPDKKIPEALDL